ncbi:MAG: hypothetical protein ACLP81_09325 [Acidimicrobiales bacterium]
MTSSFAVARSRPRTGPVAAATCAATCLLLGAPLVGVAPASAAPGKHSTSTAVMAATKKAMDAQKSVHCVISAYDGSTKQTTTVTEDAGETRGLETLVVGTAEVKLRLTPTAAYLWGNSKGLSSVFGMSASQIAEVGAKWVFAKTGTSQYAEVKSAVSIASLLASLLPAKTKVKIAAGHLNGKSVDVLSWTTTSQSKVVHIVLDVAAKGPSLPVQLTAVTGKSHEKAQFNRWGESIHVPVPTATVELGS